MLQKIFLKCNQVIQKKKIGNFNTFKAMFYPLFYFIKKTFKKIKYNLKKIIEIYQEENF